MPPLFEFFDTFSTTVPIGRLAIAATETTPERVLHEGTLLPIQVKRLSKAELEVVALQWDTLMVIPRGTANDSGMTDDEKTIAERRRIEEWEKSVRVDRLKFFDQAIREYVTLDEGLIVDRGKPVTDGAGLIGVFHSRKDFLAALVTAVVTQNHLSELFAKNLTSPQGSGTGSVRRIQARGGDRPGPIATHVDDSSTADRAAATGSAGPSADDPSRSGESTDPAKVH